MTTIKERLQKEVVVSEGYLAALFWNNPDLYNFYSQEKINSKTFLNEVYGYFYGLGRELANKGIVIFDDISVAKIIQEMKLDKYHEKYGGTETIQELMKEVKGKEDNLDAHYNEIKKYNLIKSLVDLFGEKVLESDGKYNYKKMTKEQLHTYWNDKLNQLALDGDNKYDEHYLLEGLEDAVEEWDQNPAVGLPFYQSEKMTRICTGWDYGNVYIFGGFGGSGKTSIVFNKVVMSCIEHKEKLLVICNEQSLSEFKKLLYVTAMGVGTKSSIQRQRLNEGNFTDEEHEKLKKAADWVKELCEGDEKIVTFVFMENYIIDDVKKLIKHYAARGIRRVLVDTGKPSEGMSDKARWEVMTDDFKELYKLARTNGGGLNLAMWVNVQLSDSALNRRFLNEHALGESKKIKNEASVMFMSRTVWDDELTGGKHELKVTRYVPDPFMGGYKEEEFTLDKGEQWILLFTSKNRRGMDNKTGQRVLVLKPNFNNNTFKEVGWTTVYDDKNY
ncbi:DnaB-like helicase C-terminal domain-containing protein [Paenibacillus cremeus]|uniref:Replicative DNA helicase n=1 Tax=Paenibacillus cremeus TaxID=2163881 RepID=A0A559KCK8_9BACL|nr:DnaB-like helicase C-terminal domain-containing protein [Paenibacillus cremeus]TVY09861.1 replicative DNA helicase [Paenibacillus cremeus]